MLDIVILLLEGSELSAQELAERFNVTEKTIYRDIDFIREAGIDIVGKRGVKGGFRVKDKDLVKNKRITLKEQHKLMKLSENQDRIPEEQLNEIMNSIENLFKDNRVDWIDAEFDDPKLNEIFLEIKDAIVSERLILLKYESKENALKEIKVRPYKISIRKHGCYLVFQNIVASKRSEILFEDIVDIKIT